MADVVVNRKRQKGDPPQWRIVLENGQLMRTVVDAVGTVMSRVSFKVERVDDAAYLMVDSADVAFMCCVSARLRLDKVTFPENEDTFNFCVDCKHVSSAIDSPSCAHMPLIIEGHDSIVLVKMLDSDEQSVEVCAELPTFVEDEPVRLDDIAFALSIEIDIAPLRDMIKKARKAHTEHLRLQVFLTDTGAQTVSTVVFSIDGDWGYTQKFSHQTVKDVDGSHIVRAAAGGTAEIADSTNKRPEYEGLFPIEKVDAFLKILTVRMITAKAMNDKPIMFFFPLGGTGDDNSHIRFLLAPVNESA